MNIRKILCFLCFAITPLQAAAPATHVYFAQLWMHLNHIDDHEDQSSLIAGTLFPDIRYLGTIKREKTHEKGLTPQKIREEGNKFNMGMKVHAYLDEERECIVKKTKVLQHLKTIPDNLRVLFLKTLEDEILWDNVNTLSAQQVLSRVYPEELQKNVTEEIILEWHATMIDYFDQKPSLFLKSRASRGLGFLSADKKEIEKWSVLIPAYAKKKVFINYMTSLTNAMLEKFKAD